MKKIFLLLFIIISTTSYTFQNKDKENKTSTHSKFMKIHCPEMNFSDLIDDSKNIVILEQSITYFSQLSNDQIIILSLPCFIETITIPALAAN